MPSGAKKRKAAKKKKEIESTTPSNNPQQQQQQQQGENELKSIDEKGSDGDSPAYRNHGDDQNNQFNEGSEEVEEIEVKPSAAAVVAKSSEEKVGEAEGGKEGVVEIEWDMESEESLEKIDSPKDLNYGSRKNNGGSNDVIETGTAKNSKDESYNNSVAEVSDDLVKAVTSVTEMQSGGTVNDILEKPLGSRAAETDLAVKRNEDKVHVLPDEVVRISSLKEPETREFDGKVSSSVSQSSIPEATKDVENVKGSNAAESSENQPPVAPLMVHKTSWLSCCGLFDVLSGSSR
uniref:Uncharacterized protein n=1 Tax=Medicago truncatula TaxID=3880 RepID=I3SXP1_MEDTR|nr:unknown [Medicago truncatula]